MLAGLQTEVQKSLFITESMNKLLAIFYSTESYQLVAAVHAVLQTCVLSPTAAYSTKPHRSIKKSNKSS